MTGKGNKEAKIMSILQIKNLIIKYVNRFSIHSLTDWITHLTKISENKATKSIAKSLAPTIAKAVEERTGSQLAGNLSNAGVDAYAGSGLKKKRGKGIITYRIEFNSYLITNILYFKIS